MGELYEMVFLSIIQTFLFGCIDTYITTKLANKNAHKRTLSFKES